MRRQALNKRKNQVSMILYIFEYVKFYNNISYKSIAVSDEEPDEKVYIVYHAQKPSESLFLTISSNYIREKDALNDR